MYISFLDMLRSRCGAGLLRRRNTGKSLKGTGGFDKDGFAMKNGILEQGKKKVLLIRVALFLGSEKAITELVSESGDWSEGASFQMI